MSELLKKPISAATRCCGVYGHPVRHSASPAMQNAGIQALGLDWRYLAFDVKPSELKSAIEGAKVMGFIGLNLTLPHKLLALELVDELDATATAWQAVNTIRFETLAAGAWQPVAETVPAEGAPIRAHGFNTDADALVQALQEELGVALSEATVLLLGAGGAGRMAALKLASEGVGRLFIVNRTPGRAEALVREVTERFSAVRCATGYPAGSIDLVVNATSLGLKPEDPLPLDEACFALGRAGSVYDMIYRPARSRLLRAAEAAGCKTANGLGMLLYQGAKALELWSGRPAPIPAMRQALEANVYGSGT